MSSSSSKKVKSKRLLFYKDAIVRREEAKRKLFLERNYEIFLLINEQRIMGKTFKEIEVQLRSLGYSTSRGSQYYASGLYRVYMNYRRYLGIQDNIKDLEILSKANIDELLAKEAIFPRARLTKTDKNNTFRPLIDIMLDTKLSGRYIKLGSFYGYVCYMVGHIGLFESTDFEDLYHFMQKDVPYWYDLLFFDPILNVDLYYEASHKNLPFKVEDIDLSVVAVWLDLQSALEEYPLQEVFIVLHDYIHNFINHLQRYLYTRYYRRFLRP